MAESFFHFVFMFGATARFGYNLIMLLFVHPIILPASKTEIVGVNQNASKSRGVGQIACRLVIRP
ncbi:hypothetical protein [Mangrovibacterium sp.]|uniref:hypothetical protein n=1 Tax=Mangrovibacterium sp. TaxID=1961364 RepID=UPI003568A1E0